MRSLVQDLLLGKIARWPNFGENEAYQITTRLDCTWVHADEGHSGVLFLTPEAPVEAGISFYRHKSTGAIRYPGWDPREKSPDVFNRDAATPEAWHEVDRIGNVYNRIVLFPGSRFHAASGYFGDPFDLRSQRLTQVFFFALDQGSSSE